MRENENGPLGRGYSGYRGNRRVLIIGKTKNLSIIRLIKWVKAIKINYFIVI